MKKLSKIELEKKIEYHKNKLEVYSKKIEEIKPNKIGFEYMKKLVLLLAVILFVSCSKEDETCCNEIVYVVDFVEGNGYHHGYYVTKNQCSGIQEEFGWDGDIPKKGDCK